MKRFTLPSLAVIAAFACLACNDDPAGPASEPYLATVNSGTNLDELPSCDVETPCPDGLSCFALLDGESDELRTVCVGVEEACALIECSGDCIVAESYPAQLFCDDGGNADHDDCDGPVSSDDSGQSEPGNPGEGG